MSKVISYSKPFIAAFLSLIALLAIASCGDSESEPTATEEPSPLEIAIDLTEEAGSSDYETCYKPTEELRHDLAKELKEPGTGIRALYMLRHSFRTDRWTLAGDLEGPRFENEGPIAMFNAAGKTVERITVGNIVPFNDAALDNTNLDQFFRTVDEEAYERFIANRIDGLNRLEECIAQELASNPDTPVYWAE